MRPAPSRTATILLVEDDAITCELAAQILRSGGFEVVAAPNGEQALVILRAERHRIDWLVATVDLPGLVCGWLLADEFRSLHPDRQTILVSGRLAGAGHASAGAVPVRERMPLDVLRILKEMSRTGAEEGAPAAESLAHAA